MFFLFQVFAESLNFTIFRFIGFSVQEFEPGDFCL